MGPGHADAVEFDRNAAHASIQSVHPGKAVFELSERTGQGMTELLDFIRARQVQP